MSDRRRRVEGSVASRGDSPASLRVFDGVVCFGGEDWWYHNRGHFDMQIMRRLSARVPVVYVNSIGMRTPRASEGRMFRTRVARKLRSIGRGLRRVDEGLWVTSVLTRPGFVRGGMQERMLAWQVRRASGLAGIERPLVWVACPAAARCAGLLGASGLVYQRTDRYESFEGVRVDHVRSADRSLKQRADMTVFCSRRLMEQERHEARSAAFVDHGVDYERFADAGDAPVEPEDLRGVRRPRVGFIGGIDSHTFDPRLFCEVASALSEVEFVLVGACSLPEGWCGLANVRMLGRKQYEDVPGYMASCDVLIMPWNKSSWIRACNPVKLKEYLAVGRPVVSVPFPELERFGPHVRVAGDAEGFVSAIRGALRGGHDPSAGREAVRSLTWDAQGGLVFDLLRERGLYAAERVGGEARRVEVRRGGVAA